MNLSEVYHELSLYCLYLCRIIFNIRNMNQQPTMRTLLQREITEQECYIKKTLTKLGVPFKKSLHFRVNKAYTSFSVKLKKQFSSKEVL